MGIDVDDRLSAVEDRSGRRARQSGDDPEQSGLPASRGAEQADELPGANDQLDVLQRDELLLLASVGLRDLPDGQELIGDGRGLGQGHRRLLEFGFRTCRASRRNASRRARARPSEPGNPARTRLALVRARLRRAPFPSYGFPRPGAASLRDGGDAAWSAKPGVNRDDSAARPGRKGAARTSD